MENLVKHSICTIVLFSLIGIAPARQSQPQTGTSRQNTGQPETGATRTAPQTGTPDTDNTKMNERDRQDPRLTADQQGENESDRNLSASIRKSITDDKSMSTYAKNVKIISQNGTVTLKGPVRSEAEKKAIEAAAKKIAGNGKVNSEITVEPESR
jgi:hyperosmotically inducible periplasmic protein